MPNSIEYKIKVGTLVKELNEKFFLLAKNTQNKDVDYQLGYLDALIDVLNKTSEVLIKNL